MGNDFDFNKALDICLKFKENNNKVIVLIDDNDVKMKLLNHFKLKDISSYNNNQLNDNNLIICSLKEHKNIPLNIINERKEFYI